FVVSFFFFFCLVLCEIHPYFRPNPLFKSRAEIIKKTRKHCILYSRATPVLLLHTHNNKQQALHMRRDAMMNVCLICASITCYAATRTGIQKIGSCKAMIIEKYVTRGGGRRKTKRDSNPLFFELVDSV
ncbi:MAG: Co/Zn/Cd efflux system component, partial [Bacillariaceae sp.]